MRSISRPSSRAVSFGKRVEAPTQSKLHDNWSIILIALLIKSKDENLEDIPAVADLRLKGALLSLPDAEFRFPGDVFVEVFVLASAAVMLSDF